MGIALNTAGRVLVPDTCNNIDLEVDNIIAHLQATYSERVVSSHIVVKLITW